MTGKREQEEDSIKKIESRETREFAMVGEANQIKRIQLLP
jgi:hypothetical protein